MENKLIRHQVGDKVIALTNPSGERPQPRKRGKVYTVGAVKYCAKCGEQMINVAGQIPYEHTGKVACTCGHKNISNENLHWTMSSHFAPLQDIDNLIQEAIEKEDYELAGVLTEERKQ